MSRAERPASYIEPSAPFAELAFYVADQPSEETLAAVVAAMITLGSEVTGPALLSDQGKLDSYLVPNAGFLQEQATTSWAQLAELQRTSPHPVSGVRLGGGLRHAPNSFCEIRVSPVQLVKPVHTRHSIAIWTDGIAFDGSSTPAERRSAARKILPDFIHLIEQIRPSYAAFNVEMDLMTPAELAVGDSLPVRDIYLAQEYVGQEAIAEVLTAAEGFPVHQLDGGVLILSGTLHLALRSRSERFEEARQVSATAAKVIVQAEKRRSWGACDEDRL